MDNKLYNKDSIESLSPSIGHSVSIILFKNSYYINRKEK